MFLLTLTTLLVIFITSIYIHYKISFTYWRRKGLQQFPAAAFPLGNLKSPLKKTRSHLGFRLQEFYNYFKSKGEKHGGFYMFSTPIYMPFDMDLLKHIMVKDFDHFTQKGVYHNEKDQPITGHLFRLGGERWKKLRMKLTPTFTSGKMKMMFNTLMECSAPLVRVMGENAKDNKAVDIKDVAARFTTDVIGSCAFGIECNSFKDENSEFRVYGRKTYQATLWTVLKRPFQLSLPGLCRFLGVIEFARDVEGFFTNTVEDTVRYRKENGVSRKDFMQLLIELMERENPEERITKQEVINQSFVFFNAGFETSSTTMTLCLFELSQHEDIQERVRAEIEEVLEGHGGEITYEAVEEMKYMQQVLDETMRKYCPVPVLNRQCSKQYKVPDTDIVLDEGTLVFIPAYAIQHDPEYFPEPEVFDPDRFSPENKREMNNFAFLPFGSGPRACIGLRFGYMQAKVGLAVLLKRFRFTLNSATTIPLEFNDGIILSTKNDILLDCAEIN